MTYIVSYVIKLKLCTIKTIHHYKFMLLLKLLKSDIIIIHEIILKDTDYFQEWQSKYVSQHLIIPSHKFVEICNCNL